MLGLTPGALRGDHISIAALLSLLGWMGWRCGMGPSAAEETQIGGRIVAEAHLYGCVAAALLLAVECLWRALRRALTGVT